MLREVRLLVLLLSILQVSFALKGTIQNVFNLSTINTVEYAASDAPLRIKCAPEFVMANSSFARMIKIWRLDENEEFDVSKMTFIQSNAIIQFTTLTVNDTGLYQCCVHGYAYEDFDCYNTQLYVSPATKPTQPAAYNANITYGQALNAKHGEAYFIRLFYPSPESINCTVDGQINKNIYLGNKNFPADLNSDILIPNFNETHHAGFYECDAIVTKGNETQVESAHFTVVSSMDSNMHTSVVDATLAAKYRNGNVAASRSYFFLFFLIVLFM